MGNFGNALTCTPGKRWRIYFS